MDVQTKRSNLLIEILASHRLTRRKSFSNLKYEDDQNFDITASAVMKKKSKRKAIKLLHQLCYFWGFTLGSRKDLWMIPPVCNGQAGSPSSCVTETCCTMTYWNWTPRQRGLLIPAEKKRCWHIFFLKEKSLASTVDLCFFFFTSGITCARERYLLLLQRTPSLSLPLPPFLSLPFSPSLSPAYLSSVPCTLCDASLSLCVIQISSGVILWHVRLTCLRLGATFLPYKQT